MIEWNYGGLEQLLGGENAGTASPFSVDDDAVNIRRPDGLHRSAVEEAVLADQHAQSVVQRVLRQLPPSGSFFRRWRML